MKNKTFALIFTATSLLIPVASQGASINGKEWMQLTDIGYHAYTEFDAVFDSNGIGTGILGGTDFTGWTWATQADVNDLFATYFGGTFSGIESGVDLSQAVAYFNDFDALDSNATARWNYAWTIDHKAVEVTDRFAGGVDYFDTNHSSSGSNTAAYSAYVFRNTVPEPGTIWLLALGLIGFLRMRKIRKIHEQLCLTNGPT